MHPLHPHPVTMTSGVKSGDSALPHRMMMLMHDDAHQYVVLASDQ